MTPVAKLFVYGTLKLGHGNNSLLWDAHYYGKATTVEKFAMYGMGVPSVTKEPKLYPIQGELWGVDETTLNDTDALEGHPHWYRRELVEVLIDETGESVEAWIYLKDEVPSTQEIYVRGQWPNH